MSQENQKTLETYTAGVQEYIEGTKGDTDEHTQAMIDLALMDRPHDTTILEIGAAFGREAKYMASKGYWPDLTDGSAGFVEYLSAQGMPAKLLDVVNQPILGQYDVIFAFAVFLHFTDEDFDKAVANVRSALKKDGVFVFSLMRGEGERWTDAKLGAPRYFRYWQEDELRERLWGLGMSVTEVRDGMEGRWMFVVAEKVAHRREVHR